MSLILDKENPLATKVRTRDGKAARIIRVDKNGLYSIVALIKDVDCDLVAQFTADGKYYQSRESPSDLVNVEQITDQAINVVDSILQQAFKLKEILLKK